MTASTVNAQNQASTNSPAAPSPHAPDVSPDTKRSRPIASSFVLQWLHRSTRHCIRATREKGDKSSFANLWLQPVSRKAFDKKLIQLSSDHHIAKGL